MRHADPAPPRFRHGAHRENPLARDAYARGHTGGGGNGHGARPRRKEPAEKELVVDAIFSAHSDGLMVILRKSTA